MRVLVTGAFGFVGTAVVSRLAKAGCQVVALTHREAGAVLPKTEAVEVVHGNVLQADDMAKAVHGVDAICHLAALTRVRESFDQPEQYHAVNVDGTRTLLDAAMSETRRRGVPLRWVQASTAAVYGVPERQPIAEDAPPSPTNPYGESKLAADSLLLNHGAEALGVVVLRAFNVAGAVNGRADDDLTRIIPKAIAVARGVAELLQVNGDGSAVRDFVHVDDLASAFEAALSVATPGCREVLNIGATGATVAQIIATVEEVSGRRLRVEHLPPKPEPPTLLADTARARHVLGWSPEHSDLLQIIRDAWAAAGS
jgi:UDP-glucose 4-epimerase